ncbi:hypothetical protein AB0M10_15260 [Streptomyces sp. NPDC051840]|uniref:hypothetical protein n=1 Tax=Streptomyces sp. NPDC051840 TaxID=3154752 RepID=UPI00343B9B54
MADRIQTLVPAGPGETFRYVGGVLLPSGTTESAVRSLWEAFLAFGDVDHRNPAHSRCAENDTRPTLGFVRVERRSRTGALLGTTVHPNLLAAKWWGADPLLSDCHELLTCIAFIPNEGDTA